MNRIRVNADDLGLHADIDQGILACADQRALSAVSVCATGSAVDWPKLRELKRRGIRIGVHLTLTHEPWATTGRSFASWPRLAMAMLSAPRRMRSEVRAELDAQIARFLAHDIRPDHIDSHQHVHVFPGIWPLVLRAATEHDISYVRLPAGPSLAAARRSAGGLGLHLISRVRGIRRDAYRPCIGIARSGHNTLEQLEKELRCARGRDLELVVHPGVNTPAALARFGAWGYDWDAERAMLLDPRFLEILAQHTFEMER